MNADYSDWAASEGLSDSDEWNELLDDDGELVCDDWGGAEDYDDLRTCHDHNDQIDVADATDLDDSIACDD